MINRLTIPHNVWERHIYYLKKQNEFPVNSFLVRAYKLLLDSQFTKLTF